MSNQEKYLSKNIQHACTFCDKSFSTTSTRINHEKYIHSDKRAYICNLCPKTYKDNKDLQKHHTNVHSEQIRKCEKCFKQFRPAYF